MLFRILVVLACIASVGAITKALCQEFCSSVNGNTLYDYCSPMNSFATQTNQTCYKKCVNNCYNKYHGSCITDSKFKCCLDTKPAKRNEFHRSGCYVLYNNVISDY